MLCSGDVIGGFEPDRADAAPTCRVLVVIPCLNECRHIADLIEGTLKDTLGFDRLIVVADGGSTDGTIEILAAIAADEPCVKILSNPRKIQSAGMNLAARAFADDRDWLVRLDAHAAYPAGFIEILIAEARRTEADSVVVSMVSHGTAIFQRGAAIVQNSVLGTGGAAHRRSGIAEFVDHGHHALFDLRRFLAVGGYDERLSHNEDADFDIRLARAGGKIWLTREAEVIYYPRSSATALFRQYMNYGRGRAGTLMRHGQVPKVRQLLPAFVAPALLAIVCSPLIPIAAVPAILWGSICLLLGVKLGFRQGLSCALAAGVAAMIMHCSWSIGFWSELLSRSKRHNKGALSAIGPVVAARS